MFRGELLRKCDSPSLDFDFGLQSSCGRRADLFDQRQHMLNQHASREISYFLTFALGRPFQGVAHDRLKAYGHCDEVSRRVIHEGCQTPFRRTPLNH